MSVGQELKYQDPAPPFKIFWLWLQPSAMTWARSTALVWRCLSCIHADGDWQTVEGVLKDMATVSEYLQAWKLKLSTTKTVLAVFHLNNEAVLFCSEPKYLRVPLDRSLTYRLHLESLRKKLT